LIAVLRGKVSGQGFHVISGRDGLWILLRSSPTATRTACFTYAATLGPLAITSAILSTMMVVVALLSYVAFMERVSTRQWIMLLVVPSMVCWLEDV
jgi:drug/metabolite transporter (DMT)-like permease